MNCEYNFVYLTLYHYTFILDYTLYSCSYNIYINIHSYSSYRIVNTQVILVNYSVSIKVCLTYKRSWN